MKKQKLSQNFLFSIGILVISFFVIQGVTIPNLYGANQTATTVRASSSKDNVYKISPSKTNPSVFNFNYVFGKENKNTKETYFDIPVVPFDQDKAQAGLKEKINFGSIHDIWGYPVRYNAYIDLKEEPKAQELSSKSDKKETSKKDERNIESKESEFSKAPSTSGALKNLDAGTELGVYNCRASTTVTGYFKAYFEDVAVGNGVGYDDQVYGANRRAVACQVLQDISELIKLDTTTVIPDIIFMVDPGNIPPNALAAASAYNGFYLVGPDNGSLHRHIISGQDPTPVTGFFDALVITNFIGIPWSVDSTLNPNTYDFYSVIYHEILHNLGFRGLLPSTISSPNYTYNTFDSFSYKDESLSDSFINLDTGLVDAPNGAPSPWFTSNEVVYQGTRNIVGANPGPVVPIYSPSSWEPGSSLSHFDMNRANGEVFIMNPSIGTNTERQIHADEKEVLCQLGYMVLGLNGCQNPTPFALDDVFTLDGTNAVCASVLLNDIGNGGVLKLNSLIPINTQMGDGIIYKTNDDCTGTTLPNIDNSKSFSFTPVDSSNFRLLKYTFKNALNRISFPARVDIVPSMPSCADVTTDPDEYICNGTFEHNSTPVNEPHYVQIQCSAWGVADLVNNGNGALSLNACNYSLTPDVIISNDGNFWSYQSFPAPPNTDFPFMRAGIIFIPGFLSEKATMKLKEPLVPGQEYTLRFDYSVKDLLDTEVNFKLFMGAPINIQNGTAPSPNQSIFTQAYPGTHDEWQTYTQTFIAGAAYESVVFGLSSGVKTGMYGYGNFDNVSIKLTNTSSGLNSISGKVYQDLNNNGVKDINESYLSGIEISIFPQGQTTSIQTVSSQNIPDLGEYQFTNIANGTYNIALTSESLFQSVTQPGVSSGLPGFNHIYPVTVLNGQVVIHKDFGVKLVGDPISELLGCTDPVALNYNPLANIDDHSCAYKNKTDIAVKKILLDGSLSSSDRNIIWRIEIKNLGSNPATNILVKDVMPTQFAYLGYDAPMGVFNVDNNNIGHFAISYLGAGESAHIDIKMKVPLSPTVCGKKKNTAQLVSLDQYDDEDSNNSAYSYINLSPCLKVPGKTPPATKF